MNQDIAVLIDKASRLAGQRVASGRMADLAKLPENPDANSFLVQAWTMAGLQGLPLLVNHPTPASLPLAAWHSHRGWCLVIGRHGDGSWRTETLDGSEGTLKNLDDCACFSLPRRSEAQTARPRALALVWRALLARKGVFLDAVLATGLVNLLTLASSIFSMQVYDRVIPNQGFQTLWVLSVGVLLAVVLEFILKMVRSTSVDKACNAMDQQLSEWFFARMMSIRMEARPASVGTLASQVKGFEMVRGVLASTSLFVLTDVPFALFFIAAIAIVGGWLVLVPIVALPLALTAGLIFQKAIERHTRSNQAGNNRKAGLLVEAVDGAESLKAYSAEWKLQGRWSQLVVSTGESDQSARSFSTLSQNITVALQQVAYVALIALGAYLVTINQLTMGGLLACTIISNRAMMPIVQLPGVMVQWAHARTAIEGLDQIIALPSEADDANNSLAPQSLEGRLRLERVRYTYASGAQPALEIERLEIKPGERIGVLGAIGSGKSTLLKLASGLYRPTEGKLFMGGIDMTLLDTVAAREYIGYLPQDARMFSGTLRENLLLGLPDPGDEMILQAARRTGLSDLIGAQPKGLGLVITEGGRGVSGGQKQLIMLTRTLLAKPRVWLLDEPTGAMDSLTESRIVELLRDVTANGATLIAATHKTALLPLFDRLIVMQNGRIMLDGPRDAVLAKLSGRAQPTPQEQHA
jgi:ATP-binding cassette subfamily C protein LapB